jgi:hypothetical protein
MEIKAEHKKILKHLGLKEADFERFDGISVTYEFDTVKGVRLYDPHYETSYDEYIDVEAIVSLMLLVNNEDLDEE